MSLVAPVVLAVSLIVGWANAHALADLRAVAEARSVNAHALVALRAAERVETTRATEPVAVLAGSLPPDSPPGRIAWRPEVERWRQLVARYFQPADVEHALAIIRCESVGDPDAVNPSSGTGGLFQHRPQYWSERSTAAGWAGWSMYDPEANTAVAAWLVYSNGGWAHWSGRAWNVDSCQEWACEQGVC